MTETRAATAVPLVEESDFPTTIAFSAISASSMTSPPSLSSSPLLGAHASSHTAIGVMRSDGNDKKTKTMAWQYGNGLQVCKIEDQADQKGFSDLADQVFPLANRQAHTNGGDAEDLGYRVTWTRKEDGIFIKNDGDDLELARHIVHQVES